MNNADCTNKESNQNSTNRLQRNIQVSIEITQSNTAAVPSVKAHRNKRVTVRQKNQIQPQVAHNQSQLTTTTTTSEQVQNQTQTVEVIDVENDKSSELCCIDLTKEDNGEIAVIQEVKKKTIRANNKRNTNGDDLDATIIIDDHGCASPPKRVKAANNNATKPNQESAVAPRTELCCPVCLDNLDEIKAHKKTLMSTFCGHIICNACLDEHFKASMRCGNTVCPTCRTKISRSKIHSLYL